MHTDARFLNRITVPAAVLALALVAVALSQYWQPDNADAVTFVYTPTYTNNSGAAANALSQRVWFAQSPNPVQAGLITNAPGCDPPTMEFLPTGLTGMAGGAPTLLFPTVEYKAELRWGSTCVANATGSVQLGYSQYAVFQPMAPPSTGFFVDSAPFSTPTPTPTALAAASATFVVNSTGDADDLVLNDGICDTGAGECTFRAAVQEANSSQQTADTILFNIAGGGSVATIAPLTRFPDVTSQIFIDGSSQVGGTGIGIQFDDTNLASEPGNVSLQLQVGADNSTLQGFAFIGPLKAVLIRFNTNVTVRNNYVGLTAAGVRNGTNSFQGVIDAQATAPVIEHNVVLSTIGLTRSLGAIVRGNIVGLDPTGTIASGGCCGGIFLLDTNNAVIGGPAVADRNIISGLGQRVSITRTSPMFTSDGNIIQNNYIGTDITGTAAIAGSAGILVETGDNQLIDNLISGNDVGVNVWRGSDVHLHLHGNRIGTDASGTAPIPNQVGILVQSNSTGPVSLDLMPPGGPGSPGANIIAFNQSYGVLVNDPAASVEIRGNSIHDNRWRAILLPDTTGARILGNAPLNGTACPNCVVDIYSDAADETAVYEASVTASGGGTWSYAGAVSGPCVTVIERSIGGMTTAPSPPYPSAGSPSGNNNDADFIELGPAKAFDDLTSPMSDESDDVCDDDDDNDGLTDADEASGVACSGIVTDPLDADSDNDRRIDGVECRGAKNPTDATSFPIGGECATGVDQDHDGLIRGFENCLYATYEGVFWEGAPDSDGDGCSDLKEAATVNGDRVVNAIDLALVASAFGGYTPASPPHFRDFDVTKDSAINAIDLGLVASVFGPC